MPVASDSPVNDIKLVKQIKLYRIVKQGVSDAAMCKLKNHLWYVGPEFILLSLFSDKLSVAQKRSIVESMKNCGENWNERGLKLENCDGMEEKELHELVTSSSTCALRSLCFDIDFIFSTDPDTWKDNMSYHKAKTSIDSLKVVNDAAERSVALMSAFSESITKNEAELQRLIQVVEDHHKRAPNALKSTLKEYNPR